MKIRHRMLLASLLVNENTKAVFFKGNRYVTGILDRLSFTSQARLLQIIRGS